LRGTKNGGLHQQDLNSKRNPKNNQLLYPEEAPLSLADNPPETSAELNGAGKSRTARLAKVPRSVSSVQALVTGKEPSRTGAHVTDAAQSERISPAAFKIKNSNDRLAIVMYDPKGVRVQSLTKIGFDLLIKNNNKIESLAGWTTSQQCREKSCCTTTMPRRRATTAQARIADDYGNENLVHGLLIQEVMVRFHRQRLVSAFVQ
jgi:hypothetical protein